MNSEPIEISGAGFRYHAHVGRGLIDCAGRLIFELFGDRRCAVISDENTARLFLPRLLPGLAKFDPISVVVPAGEKLKSLSQVEQICEQISALDRDSFIIGLGGGVIGDLAGFVAAIYHRGIAHVQIPTTLLAMVDSAIGGKTGVNLATGKNLVGAIHQPSLVIADIDALASLPARERRQGLAEIVKHAIICDAAMFQELESSAIHDWSALVRRNIAIKASFVRADEREISGARALLNFGHTIGHALERASDFRLAHGDCVSIGMVGACSISMRRANLSRQERDRITSLLAKFELPTTWPLQFDRDEAFRNVFRDKKFRAGEIRFVVTPGIGTAQLSTEVTAEDIREGIDAL